MAMLPLKSSCNKQCAAILLLYEKNKCKSNSLSEASSMATSALQTKEFTFGVRKC